MEALRIFEVEVTWRARVLVLARDGDAAEDVIESQDLSSDDLCAERDAWIAEELSNDAVRRFRRDENYHHDLDDDGKKGFPETAGALADALDRGWDPDAPGGQVEHPLSPDPNQARLFKEVAPRPLPAARPEPEEEEP